ncbi:MAG: hypothetical protein M1829_001462 [Trizodia sp. TS-e1964]|nr:MAG: hypothetical protein M1829_001462 [Trizodia sp. TS-e1964]
MQLSYWLLLFTAVIPIFARPSAFPAHGQYEANETDQSTERDSDSWKALRAAQERLDEIDAIMAGEDSPAIRGQRDEANAKVITAVTDYIEDSKNPVYARLGIVLEYLQSAREASRTDDELKYLALKEKICSEYPGLVGCLKPEKDLAT